MKKVISLILSFVILVSCNVGLELNAFAGDFDTIYSAKEYTIGNSISGNLQKDNKYNFIKFTLNESGKLAIDVQSENILQIQLYQENNLDNYIYWNNVSYSINLGKYCKGASVNLIAGTYYFKMVNDCSGENEYYINTSFRPLNETFSKSIYTLDNNVLNRAQPIKLATQYNGMFAVNDKTDFYKITVPKGEYVFNFTSYGKGMDTILYTPEEKSVLNDYTKINLNKNYYELSKTVSLENGTYYLKLYDYSGSSNYTFSVTALHHHNYNYSYTVKPTNSSNGYDVYSCSCGAKYTTNVKSPKPLGAVKIKSVKSQSKKHQIKVIWNTKSGASGYQIYYSKNKNFKKLAAKKTVKGGKAKSYVGKNFTKGKKYYVKVRAYKNVNGKKVYGKWSNVKSVKCK